MFIRKYDAHVVRKSAARKGIDESVAIGEGLHEKAVEFRNAGAEIYSKP